MRNRKHQKGSSLFSEQLANTGWTTKSTRSFLVLGRAEWKEILRPFYRVAQSAKKFLKILVAFHEVNLRSIHYQ